MSPATKITGSAGALHLAAALLAACARADKVTWRECRKTGTRELTRGDSDNDATEIDISHCINDVNVDDLRGLSKLKTIWLWGNEIRNLDPAVFRSLPDLQCLYLDSNKLIAMPVFGAESVLPNLFILDVSHNSISKLDDPRTFSSTKKLCSLVIQYNEIAYIHPDIFLGLPDLLDISLKNNKLTYIPNKMFEIPSLNILWLSNNNIEFVAPGAFDGRKLRYLYLEGNRLTHLPENFFTGAGARLKSFCYHHNPWRCSYLLTYVNIISVQCLTRPNFSDGTEPACFSLT